MLIGLESNSSSPKSQKINIKFPRSSEDEISKIQDTITQNSQRLKKSSKKSSKQDLSNPKQDDDELNILDINYDDQHEVFLRMQDLEGQRKEQISRSVAAKSKIRTNDNKIKTYRRRIETKNDVLKDQNVYIISLEQCLKNILTGIDDFETAENFILQTLSSRKNEIQLKKEQKQFDENEKKQQKQKQIQISSSDSMEYNNILDIPSDQSFSSDNKFKKQFNKGTWTEKERQKYLQFVDENRDIFDNVELCYKERIFVKLAEAVGTRNTNQCRSFHKQLINKQKRYYLKLQEQQY